LILLQRSNKLRTWKNFERRNKNFKINSKRNRR